MLHCRNIGAGETLGVAGPAALYSGCHDEMEATLRALAVVMVIAAAALAPRTALAWSQEAAPVNQDGTNRFSDPDERLDRMTGSAEDQDRDRGRSNMTSQDSASGFSFSMTPQSRSQSPFDTAFGPGWSGQRR